MGDTNLTFRLSEAQFDHLRQALERARGDCEAFVAAANPAYEPANAISAAQQELADIDAVVQTLNAQRFHNGHSFNVRTISTEPMVVLSTAHLPEGEAHRVEDALAAGTYSGMHRDEGWLINTVSYSDNQEARGEFPVMESLRKTARETGVDWLLFDRDASPIKGLEVHDW